MKVLFFGMLKDIVGRAEERLDLRRRRYAGRASSTITEPVSAHTGDGAASILLARNQEFARPATQLADGDEIAFLPPVSGGSDVRGARSPKTGTFSR